MINEFDIEDMCEEGYGFDDDFVQQDLTGSNLYSFVLRDADGRIVSHEYRMPWDARYDDVVDQFAEFLSSVYGYQITLKAFTE